MVSIGAQEQSVLDFSEKNLAIPSVDVLFSHKDDTTPYDHCTLSLSAIVRAQTNGRIRSLEFAVQRPGKGGQCDSDTRNRVGGAVLSMPSIQLGDTVKVNIGGSKGAMRGTFGPSDCPR